MVTRVDPGAQRDGRNVADNRLTLGKQMRLTKLEHACARLEKEGVVLVINPAAWSMPRALEGASAVLVTHEHFDHFDADGLRAALTADAGLQL